jgi:hypothetical protein
MLFGVIGTLITFSVVAPLTFIANNYDFFAITTWKTSDKAPSVSNFTDMFDHEINSTATNSDEEHYLRLLSDEHDDKTDGYSEKKEVIELPEDGIIHFSIKEVLMFSSVISATDTVAALTFVKEDTEPKLFAILFGEGVINDAVCIVLYNIIKNFFMASKEGIYK